MCHILQRTPPLTIFRDDCYEYYNLPNLPFYRYNAYLYNISMSVELTTPVY